MSPILVVILMSVRMEKGSLRCDRGFEGEAEAADAEVAEISLGKGARIFCLLGVLALDFAYPLFHCNKKTEFIVKD